MHKRRFVGLLLALTLVTAACGGDEGDDAAALDDDQIEDGDQSQDGDQSGDGDQSQDDADAGAGDDNSFATTIEAMSGDSGSDWCERIRSAIESDEPSPLSFDFIGKSPDELQAQFETNLSVMEEWADVAPGEIDADVDVMVDTYRTFVDMGEAAGWNIQAMSSDPTFSEAFEDDAIETAADRIDAYSTEVCGVDFSQAGAAATPEPGAGGDDTVTQLLTLLGLPPNFVPAEQRACMSDALAAAGAFPDGIEPGYVPTPAEFEALNDAAAECGLADLGG